MSSARNRQIILLLVQVTNGHKKTFDDQKWTDQETTVYKWTHQDTSGNNWKQMDTHRLELNLI